MGKKLKEAHNYHEGEKATERTVWVNCPHCRRTTTQHMYGESLDKNLIIQCKKCNKDFTLGSHKKDAVRRGGE